MLYEINVPSPGVTTSIFAGKSLDEFYIFIAKALINQDGGSTIENRPTDPTTYKVYGLDAFGYEHKGLQLNADNSCN